MRQHPPITRLTGARLDAPRWHILCVMSGTESTKRDRLNLASVHVAYPTREIVQRDKQGRTQTRSIAAVAGYIMAKFTHAPNWQQLREQRIITGIVTKPTDWGPVPYIATQDDVSKFLGMPTEAERLEAAHREAMRVNPGDRAMVLFGADLSLAVNVTSVDEDLILWETPEGIKGRSARESTQKLVG